MSAVVGAMTRNRGVRVTNFNAFRRHREGTEANYSPEANGSVRVPTSGIPTFGTNGNFGSMMGGWSYFVFQMVMHYVVALFCWGSRKFVVYSLVGVWGCPSSSGTRRLRVEHIARTGSRLVAELPIRPVVWGSIVWSGSRSIRGIWELELREWGGLFTEGVQRRYVEQRSSFLPGWGRWFCFFLHVGC